MQILLKFSTPYSNNITNTDKRFLMKDTKIPITSQYTFLGKALYLKSYKAANNNILDILTLQHMMPHNLYSKR